MPINIKVHNNPNDVVGSVEVNGQPIQCSGIYLTYRAKDFPRVVLYGVALPTNVDINTPEVLLHIGDRIFKLLDVTEK